MDSYKADKEANELVQQLQQNPSSKPHYYSYYNGVLRYKKIFVGNL